MVKCSGLIAAVFTPFREDGRVDLGRISDIAESLIQQDIKGFYVGGGTGEGALLSCQERMAVAEEYIKAANKRVPVIVSVGHESIEEAKVLAKHAFKAGADAMAAVPPIYYGCVSIEALVATLKHICDAAPELPFYYYHIPRTTRIDFDTVEMLRLGEKQFPNLAGMKFSAHNLHDFQRCVNFQDGRYNILFGSDEMLLASMSVGGTSAVGTSYNFAAPIYQRVINSFQQGDLETARQWQLKAVSICRLLYDHGGLAAFKAAMKLVGMDCGPTRLPLVALTNTQILALEKDMAKLGFFGWLGSRPYLKVEIPQSRPTKVNA